MRDSMEYAWLLILKSRNHFPHRQLSILSQKDAFLIASAKGAMQPNHPLYSATLPISLCYGSIQKKGEYALLSVATQAYHFSHIAQHLPSFSRAALWVEALTRSQAGGQDTQFFYLYHQIFTWLNNQTISILALDMLFYYYFLYLTGYLPPHITLQPKLADLAKLSSDALQEYAKKLTQDSTLHSLLKKSFSQLFDYPLKSFRNLTIYDHLD